MEGFEKNSQKSYLNKVTIEGLVDSKVLLNTVKPSLMKEKLF